MILLTDLDRMMGGLQKSDLVIVAGRPGSGKTSLGTNIALLGHGWVYAVTLGLQLALIVAALAGVRIARYYLLVTASPAAGLWDWLRRGTPAEWEQAGGTR